MRRLALLGVVSVASFLFGASPAARADGPAPGEAAACEEADRIEQQAKALMESGRRAEAARLMSKAWRLRAQAWGAEMRPESEVWGPRFSGADSPEGRRMREERERIAERLRAEPWRLAKGGPDDVRAAVERLKAQSNELERAGKAAKAAGDEEQAKKLVEKSGLVWKEAEALEKKAARRGGEGGPRAEAKQELVRRKQAAEEWARKAKDFAASGHEAEAKEAARKAEEAAASARQLHERLQNAERPDVSREWSETQRRISEMRAKAEEFEAKAKELDAIGHETAAAEARAKAKATADEARAMKEKWRAVHGPEHFRAAGAAPVTQQEFRQALDELRSQLQELRAQLQSSGK